MEQELENLERATHALKAMARQMHLLILLLPPDEKLEALRVSAREMADAALNLAESLHG